MLIVLYCTIVHNNRITPKIHFKNENEYNINLRLEYGTVLIYMCRVQTRYSNTINFIKS